MFSVEINPIDGTSFKGKISRRRIALRTYENFSTTLQHRQLKEYDAKIMKNILSIPQLNSTSFCFPSLFFSLNDV